MPTECRRAAASVLQEAIALGANNIDHLEEGRSPFFFSLRERWMPSRLETLQRLDRIGDDLQMLGRECTHRTARTYVRIVRDLAKQLNALP